MGDQLTLALVVTGLVLFVVGDLLWLVRNTFSRPMNMRLTGGLIATGIVLISLGLLRSALMAGD
ncbi:MAG: hypothetical protein O2798_11025 [Chloroflexi bacterium]|nr:hypothetical protein [Chloroflexota bacterium]MDA1241353.1 hypothetical protein [Chloroflexota bacterium]